MVYDAVMRGWWPLAAVLALGLGWRFSSVFPQFESYFHDRWYVEALMVTTAVAGWSCWRCLRKHCAGQVILAHRYEVAAVAVASVAVVALWCAHEPRMPRVCHDEPQHMATGMLMHQDRRLGLPNFTLGEADTMSSPSVSPVYRGVLFAYLIALAHDFFGYSEHHAYAINACLGAVVLMQAYRFGRGYGGSRQAGWLCWGLMVSLPLVAQVSRSASYDLLNMACLGGYLLALRAAWRRPEAEELTCAAALGVMLALTRAESVVYLGLFALIPLRLWWRRALPSMPGALWLLLPGVAGALVTQKVLVRSYAAVSDSMNTTGKPNLGWSNLVLHGEDALAYFYAPVAGASASVWLAWLGTLAVAWLFFAVTTRRLRFTVDHGLIFGAGAVTVAFYALVLATFWGGPSQAEMTRFSLPLWSCLVFAVAVAARDHPLFLRRPAPWLGMTAAVCWACALPSVQSHAATRAMASGWLTQSMDRAGERVHAAGTLMVARSNFVYANKRWSSCSTVLVEGAPEKLAKLKQYGLIRRVVMCYPKSSDPQMDGLVQSSFGRTDLSRWRLVPLLSEPVATLPTCEVVAYEVLGIRSASGEWVMFDGPRLDLPKFDSPGAYERFVMGLIP